MLYRSGMCDGAELLILLFPILPLLCCVTFGMLVNLSESELSSQKED